MIISEGAIRDPRFLDQHDPIYASLDRLSNWFVYGHLTFVDRFQRDESIRVKKFHLLIRDLAGRYVGKRDLDSVGWFLKQEGSRHGKRFHFHFALTSDNLSTIPPDTACRYLEKQWGKIGKSQCVIVPWD